MNKAISENPGYNKNLLGKSKPAGKKLPRARVLRATVGLLGWPNFQAYWKTEASFATLKQARAAAKLSNLSEGELAVLIARAIKKEYMKSRRAGRTLNMICAAYEVIDAMREPGISS